VSSQVQEEPRKRPSFGDLDLATSVGFADVCPGSCWTVDKVCRNVLPGSMRTTADVAHGSYVCPVCSTSWMKSWKVTA